MIVRAATPDDALGMCDVLNPLIEAGGKTALRVPYDAGRMIADFVAPDSDVSCSVAEEDGVVLGFQSLVWSHPKYEPLPADWAVIATFARLGGNRRGAGRALFERTLSQARSAGVATIDATIRKENTGGQAFYGKLGFVDYAETEQSVSKRFDLV